MLIFRYFIKNNSKVKELQSLLAKIDYQISSDFVVINYMCVCVFVYLYLFKNMINHSLCVVCVWIL